MELPEDSASRQPGRAIYFKSAGIDRLDEFDCIIDVRSPGEFAVDHIPGAINCPVLDDAERAQVGTLYKESPFEARKLGAGLVSANIAHILEGFRDRPKHWKPLVCCWRGGQRSGALNIVLNQVGWAAHQLQGGYQAYRRHVLLTLAQLPARLDFRVVCGPTGSGKSRLLAALAVQGRQVLDLEALARHRGSVLGCLPDNPQPSQKLFDSHLCQALQGMDASRPIYVESESNKIGFITLPEALCRAMHAAPCLRVDVPMAERVRFLLEDYAFYLQAPERLTRQLAILKPLYGKVQLEAWNAMVNDGDFPALVQDLLVRHYDPAYQRSMHRHYRQLGQAMVWRLDDLTPEGLQRALPGLEDTLPENSRTG